MNKFSSKLLFFISFIFLFGVNELTAQTKSPFFIRFKVVQSNEFQFRVTSGGFRHLGENWYLPTKNTEVIGGNWSEWLDFTDYPWHTKINRAGGIAEFPSIKLTAFTFKTKENFDAYTFEVQLADAPNEKNVVVSFTEKSATNTIAFLAPYPLRENAKEFETGSQMTARHRKWAMKATKGKAPVLKKFDILTTLWGHYDTNLEQQEISTLKQLGFNVLGGMKPHLAKENSMRTYDVTWLYNANPEAVETGWKNTLKGLDLTSENGKWKFETMPHWVIADEVSGVDISNVSPEISNQWFRDFLISKGLTDKDLGKPINEIEYPAKAMFEPFLPHNAPLETRKILYYAGKFGQFWSAKQLGQINGLIKGSFPHVKTEILLPSHGFLGTAWSAYNIGFSYRMLDIFEVAKQNSVSEFSTEDWLGLNRMYWSEYTWTGGQTFGYLSALSRSAATPRSLSLRSLLTVSDEKYLRLKAFSGLGQESKSIFYWAFGPTYIGTENYWSDLKSMYDGIAKVNKDIEKAEDMLYPAQTVTDPVAILYSVSHDLWHTNNHAAFVEKRLLWHGLRHLQIQPNFLREEDVEEGKLEDYKVLYIVDRTLTRKSSEEIDKWVKDGGILYLAAGAATRDEFYEPFSPPFAQEVWGENAAQNLTNEQHNFNERVDLPKIKPLTNVSVNFNQISFSLPVIGSRLNLAEKGQKFAEFADGKNAGTITNYGKGQIIAVGFMSMLAYGKLANFKPSTLEEKWTSEPREIIKLALEAGKIIPVAEANIPVVETNLLSGNAGSVIVLANYTYQPIKSLTIDLPSVKPFKQAVSIEGKRVKVERLNGKVRLHLPLDWTDMILLK